MTNPTTAKPQKEKAARKPSKDGGFTLLELLVVTTILVLLAVATGTVVINYLGRAKTDAARLQIDQIEAGLDLFRLDVGRYPTQQEGITALVAAPGGIDSWRGPYIRKQAALTDPWGAEFQYVFPGRNGTYDLYSYGADGTEGGEDEAADVKSWE